MAKSWQRAVMALHSEGHVTVSRTLCLTETEGLMGAHHVLAFSFHPSLNTISRVFLLSPQSMKITEEAIDLPSIVLFANNDSRYKSLRHPNPQ